MTDVTAIIESPLGPVRLAATAEGLSGLWFRGQQHEPASDVSAVTMAAEQHPQLRAHWQVPDSSWERKMPTTSSPAAAASRKKRWNSSGLG